MDLLKVTLGMGAIIIVLTSPIWLMAAFRARVRKMEERKLGRPVEREPARPVSTLWEER